MLLGELARDLSVEMPADGADITSITADSREATPGALFAALSGKRADGASYIGRAVAAGAVAILADSAAELGDVDVPVLRAKDPRRVLALMAARFYPRQPEQLVAVTGTSGKTSVAVFVRQIFEHAGKKAASIGTIGVVGPNGSEKGSLTTPDPVALHRLLD
ncbi:MAG: Mur ligase domain-containing protein, partial [Alphaproteobacteria bacterium]